MSALQMIPDPDEDHVRVHVRGTAFAVWFHAGRACFAADVWDDGTIGLPMRLDWCDPRGIHAEAGRAATAFLAQFRLPAVAS